MALTPSTMLELSTATPEFDLLDAVSGERRSLVDFDGTVALVVMFLCNHCPFVIHIHHELDRLTSAYAPRGVEFVAINSNDVEKYPQDGPEEMRALALERGWSFPFLLDETQAVAQAFRAACTPDFFVFGGDRRLAYRGRLDASRPENDVPLTGEDLRAALDAVLEGRLPSGAQEPSMGCNIKWRVGHEPDYFG
jgi:thiol-disulfide isomerase/thioredoxin